MAEASCQAAPRAALPLALASGPLCPRAACAPPPPFQARRAILDIHTARWAQPPSPALRQELALHCTGYCGADLKALCAEAALAALRRRCGSGCVPRARVQAVQR